MATSADSFLPEIYESVALIRDLIVNDQLPHYAADAAVKDQLERTDSAHDNQLAASLFQAVQERFQQQGLQPLKALAATKDAQPVDSISFPSSGAADQVRSRKPYRHRTFESRVHDSSTMILTLSQLKGMTDSLMDFSQSGGSPVIMPESYEPVAQVASKRKMGGSESSFDENDYYSSQVDTSNEEMPYRSKKQFIVASAPIGSGTGLGLGPPEQLHGAATEIADVSDASDDYAPPAAHAEYSEDEEEYDPMHLEQESDYDPNDLDDSVPVTAKHTPVVTSKLTHIEAPQPSRISAQTVSKMSSLASNGSLQSPYQPKPAANYSPKVAQAQHHNGPQQGRYPLLDSTLQQLSQATANLSQNHDINWGTALQQLIPPPAVSSNNGHVTQPAQHERQATQATQPSARSALPARSKAERKQQTQREARRAAKLASREKKRGRRQAEESSRNDISHEGESHASRYLTQTDHHSAAGSVVPHQSLMAPPQVDRAASASVAYGQMPTVPHLGQMVSFVPGGMSYGMIGQPNMAAAHPRPVSIAPHLQLPGGMMPAAPSSLQPRMLGPAEVSFVRDQYGNVYLAQPMVAPTAPIYGYPPY